ncbi:MAG TPA: hypothetical protein VFN35_29090, partial [Ktedonobacteraceae bacterium]|nr:hypothetical protein [Ktedonobacteraceae bacterium]
ATARITPSKGTATVVTTPHATATASPASTTYQAALACNTSRSAIMTPQVGTDNSAVFYVTGRGGYQSMPSATSLIRYDLATGVRAMMIPAANNSGIIDTTLSPDKQWLLLSIYTSKQNQVETEIKLIRTDGQLLQTVYKFCAPSFPVGIDALVWSPDEQYVAFSSDVAAISVLNLATGKLQTFQGNTTTTSYKPASWINNQQLLLTGSGNTSSGLYLLDINKDVHHPLEQLPLVASLQGFCHSVALSSDGSQLFSSVCKPSASNCRGMQPSGPSTVSAMPSSGGSAHTIYRSQTNAVTNISTAGPSSLLIYIQNTAGDLKQDGLWRINTNGSGLIRLLTTNEHSCQYSPEPYPFTQIVNNGQVYTVLYLEGNQQKLVVGNLAGTSSKVIATNTIDSTNILVLVGVGAF